MGSYKVNFPVYKLPDKLKDTKEIPLNKLIGELDGLDMLMVTRVQLFTMHFP